MGVFIVAELSANHNRDLNLAKESLHAIKEIGCDAIKLQTYSADSMTLNHKSEIFKIHSNTPWDGKYLYDLYKEAAMPLEWLNELFNEARKIGLTCFSSAFDKAGVELLETLNNPIYKIASFEITDIPLIEHIARTKKPIVLSNGIATNAELFEAIEAIRKNGNNDITILHCVSAYPAPFSSMNIAQMPHLARHNVKYGLSDHSKGFVASLAACALGASMIEKHFILDHSIKTSDSAFSMDKNEFSELVKLIRQTQEALGDFSADWLVDSKDLADSKDCAQDLNKGADSKDCAKKGREFARSLFVCKDIQKGEILDENNIKSLRPNAGLAPKYFDFVKGKKAARNLAFGKPLEMGDFISDDSGDDFA